VNICFLISNNSSQFAMEIALLWQPCAYCICNLFTDIVSLTSEVLVIIVLSTGQGLSV
jgi:hypothetical protein